MSDFVEQINAVHREVGRGTIPSGTAHTVLLRRSYHSDIDDVWDALTDPKRLGRWFLEITGDLRPGGHFQLTGNAGGEILRCEPPRLLSVTWVFGDAPASQVEVRLTPDGDATLFELEHAVPDDDHWATYGPGATGVGWDLAVLGLGLHLAGGAIDDPEAWQASPEAAEVMTRSSGHWGDAHRAAGATETEAAQAAAATTAAYVPDQPSA